LEPALKDCFWGQTNKTENLKLIFFTSAKILFAFTCFRLFQQCLVLVKYLFEKFLEGKAFDVLHLDPLEFLGYLTPFLRYRGKLKIILNSAQQNFKFLRHKRLQKML
jgi:hypothetical protein